MTTENYDDLRLTRPGDVSARATAALLERLALRRRVYVKRQMRRLGFPVCHDAPTGELVRAYLRLRAALRYGR